MEKKRIFHQHGCFESPFCPIWQTWGNSEESAVRRLKPTKTSKISTKHEFVSHSIKVKTSAKTEFASPLPSHAAVTWLPFYWIILYIWTQKCNSHFSKLSRRRGICQIFDTSSRYSKIFNFSREKTRKSQQFWPKNEIGGCFTQKMSS